MNLFQRPKFISDQDMQRIHEASLYLLEIKGSCLSRWRL